MQKQLANGLVLRTLSEGHSSDREQLPHLYADVNGEGARDDEKAAFHAWTRDLMNGHVTVTPDDIFVVVDPANNDKVASATLLIPQTWRYEDVTLSVGRPELVATYPEYRGRGLVRELFAAVHERSAALGHELQVITGISNFYRQFGYTMAVDLGSEASYPLHAMDAPAPNYQPKFTLRPATADDIPNMMRWYDLHSRNRLLTEVRSADMWRYELFGHDAGSGQVMDYQMIVNTEGKAVGYLELFGFLWDKQNINCTGYVVGEESSYLATFEDVMRGIKTWALNRFGYVPALQSFGAGLHQSLNTLIDRSLGGLVRSRRYAWYVRVPEMIPFLRHIQPVLERRLENSGANRYTGELKIGFYDLKGISIKFVQGKITAIETIQGKDGYDISFPWELFWNVVFGHHTYDELRFVLPEVWASGKAAVLFDALFPKKKSWLKGLS